MTKGLNRTLLPVAACVLLSLLAQAQPAPPPTGPLPSNVETVLTLQGGNTENIAEGPDKALYITGITDKILWKVTPDGKATNFYSSPSHSAFVGVAANKDEVVLGAFLRPYTRPGVQGLDMSDVGSQILVLDTQGKLKATIDGVKGQFFNGIADMGNNSYLITDTANPVILRVDTKAKKVDTWLMDPMLARPNGLKIHKGYAYVASGDKIYKVQIDGGKPKGGPMLHAEGVRTDDFGIAPDGTIYVPTGTTIMKVSPSGEVSKFLDNVPNGAGAWVTQDGNWLYWASRAGPAKLFRVSLK